MPSKESAYLGDVRFFSKETISSQAVTYWGEDTRLVTVIDSEILLSHHIVDMLHNEYALDYVELGKLIPIHLKLGPFLDEAHKQGDTYFWSHFSILAKQKTAKRILNELIKVPLHLNWSHTTHNTSPLTSEQKFRYAIAQRNRLQQLEDEETRLQFSLDILHQCYSHRVDILEWKINNTYANAVRYSPVYLSWKAQLETFIQHKDHWKTWLLTHLNELNWEYLIKTGIVNAEDIQGLIKLANVDPPSVLTKIRVIVERIMKITYSKEFPSRCPPNLASMIKELDRQGIFPSVVAVCLNTLRQAGNIGAHEGVAEEKDALAMLPVFIRVVEWYITSEVI